MFKVQANAHAVTVIEIAVSRSMDNGTMEQWNNGKIELVNENGHFSPLSIIYPSLENVSLKIYEQKERIKRAKVQSVDHLLKFADKKKLFPRVPEISGFYLL